MARPAQMIKKYAAGVDINAADILWALLCALLSSCGTGSFAPLGPAAICAGMLTGMGSRAFLGAVIGSAAAYRWAGLAHSLVFAALCLIWGGPMRKRRRDKPVLLISAGVLIAPIFYIDSLDAAMTGLGQLSASLFFSAVFYRAAVALNRAHLGRGIGERDMTALFLTAGACCAAAAPYCMRGVSLGGILAAFTALILSGSVGIYAVACAAVAGAGAAIGGGSVAFAGAVAIGALSASALRKGKKMGVCCGFLGVCLVCAYFGDCELTHGVEATIAAILYVMIPNKKLKQLADLFEMQEQEAERRLDSLKSRVKETAEVLDRVSSLFEASPESELELFAGRQLRCMSEAMVNIPDEGERRYTLFCGTAVRPKQGVREAGDSIAIRDTGKGKLVILSDGMGSGPVARRESQTAAGLAGDLMSIGVNELDALDCVNRLLMYKSEYDMYATIDAFTFDCESGMGRFLKLGAPPSYILRRGEVIELRAETLPIGIIKGAAPARQEMELSEGDRIIMATDGVTDALGESMAEHIAALYECKDPEKMAEELIALSSGEGKINDDMSVAVALVQKEKKDRKTDV